MPDWCPLGSSAVTIGGVYQQKRQAESFWDWGSSDGGGCQRQGDHNWPAEYLRTSFRPPSFGFAGCGARGELRPSQDPRLAELPCTAGRAALCRLPGVWATPACMCVAASLPWQLPHPLPGFCLGAASPGCITWKWLTGPGANAACGKKAEIPVCEKSCLPAAWAFLWPASSQESPFRPPVGAIVSALSGAGQDSPGGGSSSTALSPGIWISTEECNALVSPGC